MSKKRAFTTADLAYISMFAIIIAVCSWVVIPSVVPFTLQTLGVFLTVGVLGGKRGTMCVLIYLLLGFIGLPVFAGFAAGGGHLISSTGGYVVGFVFSAMMMWLVERLFGRKSWVLTVAMVLGLIVCYAFGTVWFIVVHAYTTGDIGWWAAVVTCVLPYVIPDGIKIALAVMLCKKIRKAYREFK